MFIVAWKKITKDSKEHYEVESMDEFLDIISQTMKNDFMNSEPEYSLDDITTRESNLFITSDISFIGISKKDENYLFVDYRYYKEVNEKEYYESML